MLRVLVVEDHELVALALARLLESEEGVEVVAMTGSGERAVAVVAAEQIDVIVLDLHLEGGVDAVDLVPRFREAAPEARILVLSGWMDDRSVARAVQAGCHGYVVKSQGAREIVDAVVAVAGGQLVFAPAVLPKVMRLLHPQSKRAGELSVRELEVLQHLAEGLSTEQIAAAMFVSVHTVRNHVQSVIKKLGAHSRLEAVALGVKQGLVAVVSAPGSR